MNKLWVLYSNRRKISKVLSHGFCKYLIFKTSLQEIYSARRIFIAGTDADPLDVNPTGVDLDDLVSHTRHLNLASSPALEVLSAETREKIRKMQQLQGWFTTASERREADASKRTYRIGDTFCSEESVSQVSFFFACVIFIASANCTKCLLFKC